MSAQMPTRKEQCENLARIFANLAETTHDDMQRAARFHDLARHYAAEAAREDIQEVIAVLPIGGT